MFRKKKKVEYVKVKKSDLELMIEDYDDILETVGVIDEYLERLQISRKVSLLDTEGLALAVGLGCIRGVSRFWKDHINQEYLDK